jgi:hypothetical protein
MKKTDWQMAYDEVIAEGRHRLGEPPTAEEVLAYLRGELSAAAASRVREFLVYYPELVDALEAPFPFPYQGESGDADFLSDEEVARDWAALQARVASQPAAVAATPRAGRRLGRSWRWSQELRPGQLSAVAAALLAVFLGGLLLRSQRELQRLEHEIREPRVNLEHRLLLPDGQRGGPAEQPPIPLPSEADYFLLIPAVIDPAQYPDYQLDILDMTTSPPRLIWSGKGLRRRSDDTFEIWIPRAFLKPGEFRLVLFGLGGGEKRTLATYTVRLSPE